MRVAVPMQLIDAEGGENEDRKRVGPQRIHPQCHDEHDFRGAVSQQVQRSEHPVGAQQRGRCREYVDRDEILMMVRKLVLSEDSDNRVQCRGGNEQEQQAADGFEHAVDPFERNASTKHVIEGGPDSWLHRKITSTQSFALAFTLFYGRTNTHLSHSCSAVHKIGGNVAIRLAYSCLELPEFAWVSN